jgi:hypothetical protein
MVYIYIYIYNSIKAVFCNRDEFTWRKRGAPPLVVVVVDLFNLPVGLFRFKLQYYVLKFTI